MKNFQSHTTPLSIISLGIKTHFTTHPTFISQQFMLTNDMNIMELNQESIKPSSFFNDASYFLYNYYIIYPLLTHYIPIIYQQLKN